MQVKAYVGTHGNECADALTEQGAQLRFDLMQQQSPDWFQTALGKYWMNIYQFLLKKILT